MSHNQYKIKRPYRRTGKIIKCFNCKKEFYCCKNRLERGQKFCSSKCYGEYQSSFFIGNKAKNWKGGIYLDNPKKYKAFKQRIRNGQLYNNGSYTLEEWEELKKKFNYTCPSCKKKEPKVELTVDHIIPLSKNGSNTIDNIQPLCRSCNSKKHDKIIEFNWRLEQYNKLKIES